MWKLCLFRLLITVVTEKGEEESVAKTMTIKVKNTDNNYMVDWCQWSLKVLTNTKHICIMDSTQAEHSQKACIKFGCSGVHGDHFQQDHWRCSKSRQGGLLPRKYQVGSQSDVLICGKHGMKMLSVSTTHIVMFFHFLCGSWSCQILWFLGA